MPEVSKKAVRIAEIVSVFQIILPVLICILALLFTASMFYNLKLKGPLKTLAGAASRIIDNDLDFQIEAKSQDELGMLCTAFETMRKTLLNNNRELWRQTEERKRLNAAFSHNLRNPVTVLKGSIKLAQKSLDNTISEREQLTGHLALMENYTNRIERYIETMSSIQKLEETPLVREKADWNTLAAELKNIVHLAALNSCVQIQLDVAPCPHSVLIDRSILFQIMENLLSNALRFAKQHISVSCFVDDAFFHLTVTDDGCGFPDTLLKNGIQPFKKGNEDYDHFGIGLYTCHLLSARHGGGITIGNLPKGAVVSAVLHIR